MTTNAQVNPNEQRGRRALFVPYGTVVQCDSSYLWQKNLGSYLDACARCFENVRILCTVADSNSRSYYQNGVPIYAYRMAAENVTVRPFSGAKSLAALRELVAILKRETAVADFVYVFVPSFKSLLAARLAEGRARPYGIYIGADWNDVAHFVLPRRLPRPLGALAKSIGATLERHAVDNAAFTLAHGARIVRRYGGERKRTFGTVPVMNWGEEEISMRDDTCNEGLLRCLFVGTLTDRKGVIYLIDAVAAVRSRGIPIRLTIVGKGDHQYEEDLKERVVQLGIVDSVEFCGYVVGAHELLRIYRVSDVFVLPTLGEGFPRVLYEAMSQSLPIITTNVGSLPDVLTDGETALLVPIASADAIAGALERIWNEPALRRHLIACGRELVSKTMGDDPRQQFEQLLDRYVPRRAAR